MDIDKNKLKNDAIYISLNTTYFNDESFIRGAIKHELTHVV